MARAYTMRRDHRGKLRRVYQHAGCDGYYETVTTDCSGCTERGEMGGTKYGPFGCEECGHTGKSRDRYFVPFDANEFYNVLCTPQATEKDK